MKKLINAKFFAMFVFFLIFVVIWGLKFVMGSQLDSNLAFNLSVGSVISILGMAVCGFVWVFSND